MHTGRAMGAVAVGLLAGRELGEAVRADDLERAVRLSLLVGAAATALAVAARR